MPEIRIVAVPYELGRLREGVGCGPEMLLARGAEEALASAGAGAGGLDGNQLDDLVAALAAAFPVRSVSLTAYDPAYDSDGRVPPIALRVLRTVARSLA